MLISYGILWVLVIVLSLLVFALARQVGVLHERVAPAGALMPTNGPKVGEVSDVMSVTDLKGNTLSIGGVSRHHCESHCVRVCGFIHRSRLAQTVGS